MPNKEHEIPLKIIRNAPELVVPLLRDAVGYDLPEHTEVVLTSAECTDSTPRTYTPDGAVLLRAGTENALAVVVEQQARWDSDKFWTWPVYLTTVREQLRCPTLLLVLCPTDKAARDCAGRIPLGQPGNTVTPSVVGPSQIPVVTDPEQARDMPELAVLSAKAHGDHDLRTLDTVMEALNAVSSDRRAFYYDYVLAGRSEEARKYLEDLMSVDTWEWQSDFARKYVGIGREEGREEEAAGNVILVLTARGFEVPDEIRHRITSCDDLTTLRTWIQKAAKIDRPEELFD